jgi:hypothetical protein
MMHDVEQERLHQGAKSGELVLLPVDDGELVH